MKKVFIKVLSVLLVVTIFATSLPFSALATEENAKNNQTISTDMGDMSMTATNSFGEMLTESLSEQTDEQNNGYYISDIEYEGYCALVTFVTQQDCTIRVAVYEEDTGRMVTTASADVLATDTEAIVEFEDELPDYFVLKAFMLDKNVAPLCKAYTCNEMTKMYEDFLATTVEDFPEDKVINLDESEDNNFLVMSDDTETITTDGATNVLLSYNAGTGVYTFGNIDNQIKSLKKDDIFYFDNGNVEELTFIKVGAIDIDGTTAQITEAETSIEEVFDTVKINNEMSSGDFTVDEDDELDEGIIYEGVEEVEESDDEINTYAFDDSPSITFKHNYTLDKTSKPKEPKKITKNISLTGSIKIEGTAGLSIKGTFKYYLSTKFSEIEFTLTPSISLKITIEGKGRVEVKLKALDYSPCIGVYVGISPKFIVEASVKATFDATLKFTLGVGYNTTDGLVNKSEKPSFKPEFKIEGEIFLGVDLAPRAYLVKEKFAKVELSSEIGAKLTAKISTDTGKNHLCDSCLDGDIDLVGDLTGKFVIGEKTKLENNVSVKFIDIKIDIVEFYYSYTYNEFGWDNCPYKNDDSEDNGDDSNEDDEPENVTDSGKCGDNLTWTFDDSTGTLTISGNGEMDDYNYNYSYTNRPWESYQYDIKKVVITNSVTSIGNFAFYNCNKLASVTIGNSVTTIGNSSFYGCVNIANITIPDGVTTIGDKAFYWCRTLANMTIPGSIISIGSRAFNYCVSLTNFIVDSNNNYFSSDEYGVLFNKTKTKLIQYPSGNIRTDYTISDSVTSIYSWAFSSCHNLTSIIFPNSVTIISEGMFENCNSLTSIMLPDSITTIGDHAFFGCRSLTSVTIPDSVITIGDNAFQSCDSLTSITFPDSVISIGIRAFYKCTNLTSVIIPDSVTSIFVGAFEECDSLTSFTVDNNNKYYSSDEYGALFDKDKTVLFQYPVGNTRTNYIIPDNVTTIGNEAFYACENLTSIAIPDSLKEVGEYAFCYCVNIKDIYYMGTETEWKSIYIGEYNNSLTNATIHYNSTGVTYSLRSNQINMMSFAMANTTDLIEYNASTSNAISGNEYIIVVLNSTSDINDFTNTELLYIDQRTAETDGDISFNYVPKSDEDCVVYIIGVFSDTNSVKQEQVTPVNPNEPIIPDEPEYNYTFTIQQPSRTEIRNKDGIILHANVEGTAPNGSYVRWESSNGNFDEDADGSNLEIIAKNKGWTTFTAILCDADGSELARDSVEMYSKSGFFDKIGGFFRSLFGTTKIYEY